MELLDFLNNQYSENEILANAKSFENELNKIASKEIREITAIDVENFKDIKRQLREQLDNLKETKKKFNLNQIEQEYYSLILNAVSKTSGHNTKNNIQPKSCEMLTDFSFGMNFIKVKKID